MNESKQDIKIKENILKEKLVCAYFRTNIIDDPHLILGIPFNF